MKHIIPYHIIYLFLLFKAQVCIRSHPYPLHPSLPWITVQSIPSNVYPCYTLVGTTSKGGGIVESNS